MSIKRVKGDNYPITVSLKLNKSPLDLTGASVVFSYLRDNEVPKTIQGTVEDAVLGKVSFYPTINDFTTAGTYTYDIKHIKDGITTTYIIDQLILDKSIGL